MSAEGQLRITLDWQAGTVTGVGLASTRPVQASRVFIGREHDDVLRLLPLLYAVCGNAQAIAGWRALQAAQGFPPGGAAWHAHEILVQFETLREHLLRVLGAWPQHVGEAPHAGALAGLAQLPQLARRHLFADTSPFAMRPQLQVDHVALGDQIAGIEGLLAAQVFGESPAQWLARSDAHALRTWLAAARTPAARLVAQLQNLPVGADGALAALPDLHAATLATCLEGAQGWAFIAHPRWQGNCCETSSLTRTRTQTLICDLLARYGGRVWVRLLARLVELASIPACLYRELRLLRTGGVAVPVADDRYGLGWIEAARGRLVHRVKLEAGRISDYRILAPTEWNFHPQGVVAQGLTGLHADTPQAARTAADWLVGAIDPCVAYTLAVREV